MIAETSIAVGLSAALVHRLNNPDAPWAETIAAGLLWGGGTYAAGKGIEFLAEEHRRRTRPRVFISHHHEPDGWFRDLLSEAGESGELGFEIEDTSVTKRIKSRRHSRIKADLTRRVRQSDKLVVVVGEKTRDRRFVRHEIGVAQEDGKPIVAVKLDRSYRAPQELYGAGTKWVMGPSWESIAKAIMES